MQLVPIDVVENAQYVSGRDLHMFLEIKTPYTQWFDRMCDYGFTENLDYVGLSQKCEKPLGGRPQQDHNLTIGMAKQLCMLARNDKGREAREYFLQVEKDWNSPEKVMARALQVANKTIENYKLSISMKDQQLAELQPKANYYDVILQNKELLSITQIAKDYGKSGTWLNKFLADKKVQFKQSGVWFLYAKYADKGYTSSKTFIDDVEKAHMHTYWTQKGRLFIYDLLKQNGIFPLIELVDADKTA
nr:MAG TPA: antirepressor protein [Caudoviricetes sp.]